jgi:hypothetical protein
MKAPRIGAAILALLLFSSNLPAQFVYATNGNTITLVSYTGSGGPVVISNFVDEIGNNAFEGSSITSVAIPDSVTSIGNSSFISCANLASVVIGTNVTLIDDSAFYACFALADFTIPEKVGSLGTYAFVGCALTNIVIPASVTNIGTAPLAYCSFLINISVDPANTSFTSVDGVLFNAAQTRLIGYPAASEATAYAIPSNVATIDDFSMTDSALTNAVIGPGVTNFGVGVFDACYGMTAINVSALNHNYSSVGGVLFNKNQTSLLEYPAGAGGSYAIPQSVAVIGFDAFQLCQYLTNVIIPNSVKTIDPYAFNECGLVGGVAIPGTVTNLGADALALCGSLTAAYFEGNAPPDVGSAFSGDHLTVYYLYGTAGWQSTFGGAPTALWNPQARNPSVTANQLTFEIVGSARLVVVIEACDKLAAPNWAPIATNTLNVSGSASFTDPQAASYPARFYRLAFQ